MIDERETKLPSWAREIIEVLRCRLEDKHGPLIAELSKLRPQVQKLARENEALKELLTCAAKGGHATSQVVIEVLKSYSLELTRED